jgi:hypothetical protein
MLNEYQPLIYRAILAETNRKTNRDQLLNAEVTIFFRPANRIEKGSSCRLEDIESFSLLGLISVEGSHETQELPKFEFLKLIQLVERFESPIRELEEKLFDNTYIYIEKPEEVIDYLSEKYPFQNFDLDTLITVYRIKYV